MLPENMDEIYKKEKKKNIRPIDSKFVYEVKLTNIMSMVHEHFEPHTELSN